MCVNLDWQPTNLETGVISHLKLKFWSCRLEGLFRYIQNGTPVLSQAESTMKRELEDVERFLKYHRESLQQVCDSQMLIYYLYFLSLQKDNDIDVIDFWHSLFLLECRLKQRTSTHKRAQENQNHQSHQLLMHHKKETSDTYLKASELTSLDLAYYLPPVPLSELFFLGKLQKWYRMIFSLVDEYILWRLL